jgi:hypothetical protein
LLIPDPDPDFLPIPDPGSRGQKGTGYRIPDPGSGSPTLYRAIVLRAQRNTGLYLRVCTYIAKPVVVHIGGKKYSKRAPRSYPLYWNWISHQLYQLTEGRKTKREERM